MKKIRIFLRIRSKNFALEIVISKIGSRDLKKFKIISLYVNIILLLFV